MHVAILGLGPSLSEYSGIVKRLGCRQAFCDQVYAINALGSIYDCDIMFHMDDVHVQELRVAARPNSNIANMLRWLKSNKRVPVMTSVVREGYDMLQAFPLQEVLQEFNSFYFNNTAAYAIAYALLKGATHLSVFGCDFTYPNAHSAEKGRGCVEFWLGQAVARGVAITCPKNTSLLDALGDQQPYGYDFFDVTAVEDPETKMAVVTMKERETLPTAEEIEKKYDHSVHPNQLMIRMKESG